MIRRASGDTDERAVHVHLATKPRVCMHAGNRYGE